MFYSRAFQKLTSCVMALTIFSTFLLAGCTSSTVIKSHPSGAKVTIDGKLVGKTPITYADKAIVGSSHNVVLSLAGYKTTHAKFARNGQANVGAIIGGVFFLFPFLWTMDYDDSYMFELEAE